MHRAAGEFIDDQHLPFLHDVVHVSLEQRVCAQQLVHDVQSLALCGVVDVDLVPRFELLGRRHVRIVIDRVHFLRQIREHELVVRLGRHEIHTGVSEMDGVPLFVQHEQQIFLDIAVLLLVRGKPAIRDVLQLHLLHELLGTSLLKYLEKALVLGSAQLRLVEIKRGSVAVTRLERFLTCGDERVD